ncbi:MAG: GIY-YIG nuclease family protein [Sphingobacteriales bacterium]|nr:MAG: GIY-YIG nuclease family protein [Sphingobacteriales bacterium]
MHYVYILRSKKDGTYYKGYSLDPLTRLSYHNKGLRPYTSGKQPWELVALLAFDTKTLALQKEKKLKKYSTRSLEALILSSQNILPIFLKGLENR